MKHKSRIVHEGVVAVIFLLLVVLQGSETTARVSDSDDNASQAAHSIELSVAGLTMGMSHSDVKIILKKKGFVPALCTEYEILQNYMIYRTPSFGQIMQRAKGVKIPASKRSGIGRACFQNKKTSESMSIWYAQYPSGEKAYHILYKNSDRLLSGQAFINRIKQKFGKPNPRRRFATADLFYGQKGTEELVVWRFRKKIKLVDNRISRTSDSLIRKRTREIQSQIDSNGSVKTTF